MAVRIRMKKMGRRHRPFFRICAMDSRSPRDGRVIEELGYYDPMVKETDARAVLRGERIDYWLGVGAQPSNNVRVLIKKYGSQGTHLAQQQEALDRLKLRPQAPAPVAIPMPTKEEPPAAEAASETAAATEATEEATTAEAPAAEEAAADESAEEPAAAAEPEETAESKATEETSE